MAYRIDLFTHVVSQLRSGKTQDELSKAVNSLVHACRNTGKAGELSLKIKIKPDKGDTGQYFILDEVKVKEPIFDRGQTLLFGTPEGNLQRTDPAQGELELREINQPVKEPKFIDDPVSTPKEFC